MAVTVTLPVAHPTVTVVGRTVGVDPGPQDNTAGGEAAVVVEVAGSVEVVSAPCAALVVPCVVVVDPVSGDGDLEPMANPIAMPTPTAARTSAATPTRTTVLRRTVMTR